MYRFNYFTEKANHVINLAITSAEELGHNYIGSEHLLLGILKEDAGLGAQALRESGVQTEDVEKLIKENIGVGEPTRLTPDDFTPRFKRMLELAFQIARGMMHSFVGTEHLLLALLKETDSYGYKFLLALGVRPEVLVEQLFSGQETQPDGKTDGKKGKTKTPTLDEFGRDLTALAEGGKIDPVIGREKEIERVIQILSRRSKNNPCLIGEPGVGKTAIAEGLALKIVKHEVPELLEGKKIVALDLTSMVAGTKYRGDFEERIQKAMDEVKQAGNIILFIDEVHTLMGAGSAEGATDAANILKPALARGEIQVIGATTIDEYRKNIEKDAALERRFQPVTVGEPTEEQTVEILKGLRDKYEAHHKVKITDAAIENAVKMSSRYIADRFQPDKAIDLIDEAASKVRLSNYTKPSKIKDYEAQIDDLEEEKESAIRDEAYEKAGDIKKKQEKLKEKIRLTLEKWEKEKETRKLVVGENEVADVVAGWTKIPVKKLAQEESERLKNLEGILHERVVGQEEAVTAVSKAIRRGRIGLKDPKRPIGSFLFLGPTGVGKTELSKALAEAMFGTESSLIRVDMSEYMEKHSVSKMIGSPPGYVGYEEGGQLSEKVRRNPYSVILFDEIEKAHPDIFNTLLQVLDDGHLTDGQGRKVDFKNTIIILTTNLGTRDIAKAANTGFNLGSNAESSYQRMKDQVSSELKQQFRPEFLNRLDDIIVFRQLTEPQVRQIVDLDIKQLNDRLFDRHMSLELTPAAKDLLAQKGFDPLLGARPLRRVIQRDIEDAISEKILMGELEDGQRVVVDSEGEGILGEFTFRGEQFDDAKPENEPAAEPATEESADKSADNAAPASQEA